MADDPALIWEDDESPRRRPTRASRPAAAPTSPGTEPPIPGGRIPLSEAHHQFGVPPSTLASWARADKVDAVKDDGRWMVTPASVAARLSERHGGRPRTNRKNTTTRRRGAPGPIGDGTTMLVPRDAWDKLMDQLGNLHEAGQMLADARERAAKAETEALFLRERLAEMRTQRNEPGTVRGEATGSSSPQPNLWQRIRRAIAGG